jgi:hypothetical protein
MKSKLFYQLNFPELGVKNKYSKIIIEDPGFAQQFYEEKLQELQESGNPFHINMSLIYQILEEDGTRNLERYYLVAAHTENGIFDYEGIQEDVSLLRKHIASGSISQRPKRFDFYWPNPHKIAAIKLDKGKVVGAYRFDFGFPSA